MQLKRGITLKLQLVGAFPATIAWMLSCLSICYQAVQINTSLSKPLQVEYGVPQEVFLVGSYLISLSTINPQYHKTVSH